MSNYEQRPPYSEPENEAIQELSNPQPATPPATPPEEVVVVNTPSAGNNGNGNNSGSQSVNSNSPLKKRSERIKELLAKLKDFPLFELGIIKLKEKEELEIDVVKLEEYIVQKYNLYILGNGGVFFKY